MTTGAIPGAGNDQTGHDPDGTTWIKTSHWENSTWDGNPIDPNSMTKQELCDWLRPSSPYVVRGIRKLFYDIEPFADNANPTTEEINNWNLEVIRHFRRMLGVATPLAPDARLYLEARWADERKHTTFWDAQYPAATNKENQPGSSFGVCFLPNGDPIDTAGGHCGEAFFPDEPDRNQYIQSPPYQGDTEKYPELNNYTFRSSQASGVSGAKSYITWAIKLPWIIANWICAEGLTGHPGPFVGGDAKPRVGMAWWHTSPGSTWTHFRVKWRENP